MKASAALLVPALVALAAGRPAAGQAPDTAGTAAELGQRVESAWAARDLQAYLGLWRFADDQQRQAETRFAAGHFSADEVVFRVQPPLEGAGAEARLPARIFSVNEPRARVEELLFRAQPGPQGWRLVAREDNPGIEGLLHLSLDVSPYRADGMRLRLEDFELQVERGTLFTSPTAVGPTALVFVGRATVSFQPRLPAEQEQLRQFAGQPRMVEAVSAVFARIHPADFHRLLSPARLDPDPSGAARLRDAQKMFREHAESAFVLDTPLPRSPWWMFPALGDASVVFRTRRRGTLTYTLSGSEPEGISLFDRARRRQICLYPRQGQDTSYDEDATRTIDVLEHDLRVRFEPSRFLIQAEDTLKLRLASSTGTVRLRLHEDLRVQSVRSREAGEHAFFRIRHQDGLLVSLGALAGHVGEITLTVRYAGAHQPAPVEREIQRPGVEAPGPAEEEIVVDPVLVYSNRTAWYPQAGGDDYALARLRLDVPEGFLALTGGRREQAGREAGRALAEYRQDRPAKYLTVVVGRFYEAGRRQQGEIELEAHGVARTRRGAAELLDEASDMLRFFEQEFGPFPYTSLRIALIEGFVPGGHSPPGMVILSRRPALARGSLRPDPATFWDIPGFFFAHELAHQWWGHAVAGQNYRERWISEAFAQYAAALWVRHRLGEERFREVLERMARWALRHTDEGPIHLGYRLGHVKGDAQIYRAVVYDKGAYVLHMLRGVVGPQVFRDGLRSLQQRFRFRKAGTDDVRQELEKASGRQLAAYFDQWVLGTALPRLEVQRRSEPGTPYRTVIEVKALALPGPVPLELTVLQGREREVRTVTLPPSGGSWTFETSRPVRGVEANEDGGLLATVRVH